MNKIILSWSAGKDCAFALAALLKNKNYKICGLLTTTTKDYQRVAMHGIREELLKLQAQQITHIAFGDIFLPDIKQYREQHLSKTQIKPLFPLWQQPTHILAKSIINQGFKAIVTCIDTKKLPAEFLGREYNMDFINDLPKEVDPCGENGEFHTFVYDAPIFAEPINIKLGKMVRYNEFLFIDAISLNNYPWPLKTNQLNK